MSVISKRLPHLAGYEEFFEKAFAPDRFKEREEGLTIISDGEKFHFKKVSGLSIKKEEPDYITFAGLNQPIISGIQSSRICILSFYTSLDDGEISRIVDINRVEYCEYYGKLAASEKVWITIDDPIRIDIGTIDTSSGITSCQIDISARSAKIV